MSINPYDQFDSTEENPYNQFDSVNAVTKPALATASDDSDFVPGVKRGLQNLQASLYGAGALAGAGLKNLGAESVGQSLQDFGMEGYNRNIEEAKQYPAKHTFKDVYTGEAGIGGTIDWAQGTLGELVPSMAEAAVGAIAGSAVAPGPGTIAGGLAARTVIKKGIEESVKQALKRGVGNLTEDQVRKQLTGQALKKLGGKIGIGAAVMPMESGGMYADLLQNKGIDAPETALLFGALATSLEFAGGNSKLVDTFVDALSNGATGTVKKSAKELLTNIPQEALQEGGQELLSILNTVANTDEKLLTADNVERIIESMAAGAIGGGAGAVVNAGFSSQATKPGTEKTDQELMLDKRATNILTQEKDQIDQSIQKLSTDLKSNQELLGDLDKLGAKAKEENIEPTELFRKLTDDNKNNQGLLDKINSGIKAKEDLAKKEYEKLSPEDKAVKDFENKLIAKRETDAQKIKTDLEVLSKRETIALDQYKNEQDPEKKKAIADRVFNLRKEKNTLTDRQLEIKEVNQAKEFADAKKADEIRQEREAFYNQSWADIVNKDAVESGNVFQEELSSKNIADYIDYINNAKVEDRQQALNQLKSKVEAEKDNQKITEYTDYIKNNLSDIIKQEEAAKAQATGEKFYTDLFAQEKRPFNIDAYNEVTSKYAEESAAAFEKAGMAKGQTSPFTDEQQVPLTDQQQIIVDKNNFQIAKLNEQYNSTIDRDERINVLNQIDVLEKDNANIRTSIEQFNPNEQQVNEFLEFQVADNQENNTSQTITKQETLLGNILTQVKEAEGLTGQLAKFISDFIPDSKLDIKVIIDPLARSASYVGGQVNTITLRDPAQLTTSLHEITHAVTVREMKANEQIRNQVILLMDRVKAKAIKEALITPAQLELLESQQTSRGYKENLNNQFKYDNVAYGLLNENEFLAQAMGSLQFQELLKATTIADKGTLRNAWDVFVELVMKALGIKSTHKNAFGESLNLIAQLAAQGNIDQSNQMINESLEVEQRLSDVEYDEIFMEKNNLLKDIAQNARMKYHEIKLLADKALGSISTRLKNIDPELSEHLRWLDHKTSQKIIAVLKTAKPLLDATKRMSPEDKSAWNWARLNSDEGKIEQLAQKYNLTEGQNNLREKLNQIRQEAIEVGYDVGFIKEYWPRVIKDQEGFPQATQEISQRAVFTEAFRDQAKKLGISQEQFEREFPEVKADIISNLILGRATGIGGPGNIKARVYETIPKEFAKFYMDADAALMQYVYSMTKKIEARKFFGKVPQRISDLKSAKKRKQADLIKYNQLADMARAENPERLADYEDRISNLNDDLSLIEEKLNVYKHTHDYTENIGTYIDDLRIAGRIQAKDEKVVRDILDARFHEHGTTGVVNAYKNLSYIDTMGSPLSAITQIGDLAWAMYVGKVWTPQGFSDTVKNLSKAILKRSNITKEDLGIERIAQEFADGTTLSKAVNKVFWAVGLEKIDTIGKEVLINNALDQFKAQARRDPEALAKLIRPTFGSKSTDVVQEILADNPSDNVKMLLYSKLLDFQPLALSEMPEKYLTAGNGRVFYMLKTYTLKQFDVFRREVIHNIKSENPQQKLQGMTNMIQLMALLTIANAGADEIKDFMLGKESKFSDNVIDNFLTMGGASRFVRLQVVKEGFGSALMQQILPPMKFVNAASKDVAEGYKNHVSGDTSSFDHARIIDSIPGLGKLYYWHYGRGTDLKKSISEQEFTKAGTDTRLFKKQLENSQDKRTFIESNLDRFKQMKVHENFQAALNRNKAVINKLEKIPSTANVQERLGQLKAQRESILKKYLEVRETLQ